MSAIVALRSTGGVAWLARHGEPGGRELALVDASLTEESFTALLDHGAGSLLPV